MEVNIQGLLDEQRCYEAIRSLRWPNEVCCAHCHSTNVIKRGKHNNSNDLGLTH